MGYETNQDDGDIQAAIDAGMALGEPKLLADNINGDGSSTVFGIIVPKGATFQKFDADVHMGRPPRKKGCVTLTTAASFSAWVNRNKTAETVIYAKEKDTSFLAIFNGHEANAQPQAIGEAPDKPARVNTEGKPGWGDFTARYDCPLSDEWLRWHGNSQHGKDQDRKVKMTHAEFIQFIEDNLLDITTPDSGSMLSAVRAFEAKRDVKFASAKRLDNGDTQFAYAEDTQQTGGTIALPSVFEITIPVFKGGAPYVIAANLRYRISQGGLMLWYELVRPHKSLEHAFHAVSVEIGEATEAPMFST